VGPADGGLVGVRMGREVGKSVGSVEGGLLGERDGAVEGDAVGETEFVLIAWDLLGLRVGLEVGLREGMREEGRAVGKFEGNAVETTVGDAVGVLDGFTEGDLVGIVEGTNEELLLGENEGFLVGVFRVGVPLVGATDGGEEQPPKMLFFLGVCTNRFTVPPNKSGEGIFEILFVTASQYKAALMSLTLAVGFFSSSCAITPATCGAAMEVPLKGI